VSPEKLKKSFAHLRLGLKCRAPHPSAEGGGSQNENRCKLFGVDLKFCHKGRISSGTRASGAKKVHIPPLRGPRAAGERWI